MFGERFGMGLFIELEIRVIVSSFHRDDTITRILNSIFFAIVHLHFDYVAGDEVYLCESVQVAL